MAYSQAHGLVLDGCQTMQILVFLQNHSGETIEHAVSEIERILAGVDQSKVQFKLAGGNAGVMAASNEAVKQAEVQMHGALLGSVALFCWLTFRSFRAVLCIITPLAIVATLCNALMASFGIGLKVSTLPVLALGVASASITASICTNECSTSWRPARTCARRSTRRCASAVRRRCSQPSPCRWVSAPGPSHH